MRGAHYCWVPKMSLILMLLFCIYCSLPPSSGYFKRKSLYTKGIDEIAPTVVSLDTPYAAITGQTKYTLRVPIVDRCMVLRNVEISIHSTNATRALLDNCLKICDKMRAAKYLPTIERLKQFRLPLRRRFPREARPEPNEEPVMIPYTEERVQGYDGVGRAFQYLLSFTNFGR